MREDLARALQRGGIDPRGLNAIHRILLTTDGTVTHMLEAYFQEPMQVVPLAQELADSADPVPDLDLPAGRKVLRREILLRGRMSGRTALHADSLVVPDRLSARLREGLLEKQRRSLLTRTYVISVAGQGIMRITENFPEQGM
jgi:chorismate-pyruvate lyase